MVQIQRAGASEERTFFGRSDHFAGSNDVIENSIRYAIMASACCWSGKPEGPGVNTAGRKPLKSRVKGFGVIASCMVVQRVRLHLDKSGSSSWPLTLRSAKDSSQHCEKVGCWAYRPYKLQRSWTLKFLTSTKHLPEPSASPRWRYLFPSLVLEKGSLDRCFSGAKGLGSIVKVSRLEGAVCWL